MPSTVIKSMSYDSNTGVLTITFVTGLVYAYQEVPEDEYFAFRLSSAKGVYFNQHIKDNYRFEKVG